ncbi:MAG: hypothetical protein HYY01_10140 [Chloroflexi bacterium]|nr:hypothetical protein [Chloroflexota bacterium]
MADFGSTRVLVNGSVSTLVTLAASIGSQVTATYNVQTMTAITLATGG